MFQRPTNYRFDESKMFDMPRMFDAMQNFAARKEDDIESAVVREMGKLPFRELSGKRIALTGGSRGVANQARILRCVSDWFKEKGAEPFIVPAMGSHGGATADGQLELLAGYGITEEAMGVPILSDMEPVLLGKTDEGYPVYCDVNAYSADYIFPIHRVKPHTGFKAEIESGLCKMLVIGLGKHRGAVHIHNQGVPTFGRIIPAAAGIFLASGKVLAGLAIVENALDETMHIELILPGNFVEREKELLVMAKRAMPRICADRSDVLIVEEIGKNISGTGMDPNVTARAAHPLTFDLCHNHRIVVLSLSPESHGNAIGLGLADITTLEAARSIDFDVTYTNSITAGVTEIARLPVVANNDRDAVRIALCSTPRVIPAHSRIIQIRNTMELTRIRMSEAYLEDMHPEVKALSEPSPMEFDDNGRLSRIG